MAFLGKQYAISLSNSAANMQRRLANLAGVLQPGEPRFSLISWRTCFRKYHKYWRYSI